MIYCQNCGAECYQADCRSCGHSAVTGKPLPSAQAVVKTGEPEERQMKVEEEILDSLSDTMCGTDEAYGIALAEWDQNDERTKVILEAWVKVKTAFKFFEERLGGPNAPLSQMKGKQMKQQPFWTIGLKNPFRVGDIVTPKEGYTYHDRLFKITKQIPCDECGGPHGAFEFKFLNKREKGETIRFYRWWELKISHARRKEMLCQRQKEIP